MENRIATNRKHVPFIASVDTSNKVNWKVAILSGGLSGAIEICITYPTEFVKTQLQLDNKRIERQYRGSFDCIKQTVQSHGFFGLYRGLSILLLGAIPKVASRFWAYEQARGVLMDSNGKLSQTNNLACGLLAGMTEAVVAVCPMETIKVKLIDDRNRPNPQFKGLFHGIGSIVRTEGLGGIYKGLSATVLKQGTNQAIRFFVFHEYKAWTQTNHSVSSTVHSVIGGVLAGAASVAGNNPFDVIKTNMQGLESNKFKGVWDCATQLWKRHGFLGFYSGSLPRMARVCADTALTFTLYTEISQYLQKINFLKK